MKMLDKIKEHPGKAGTVAGGGLSLVLALQLFVTKAEYGVHREWQADDHRMLMDIQQMMMKKAMATGAEATNDFQLSGRSF